MTDVGMKGISSSNGLKWSEWKGMWSIVRRQSDNRPEHQSGNLSDLERHVTGTSIIRRKKGPGVIGCTFRKVVHPDPSIAKLGRWRLKDGVDKISFIAFDIDEGVSDPSEILSKVPWGWMAWSTWSDGVKSPCRFRVLIPMAFNLTAKEFEILWEWFEPFFDNKIDASCKDPCRVYGTCRAKNPKSTKMPWFRKMDSAPIFNPFDLPDGTDIRKVLEQRERERREILSRRITINVDDNKDLLEKYFQGALDGAFERISTAPVNQRNKTLNAEAYCLGRWIPGGYIQESVCIETLHQAGLLSGLSQREVQSTIRCAVNAAKKKPHTTLPPTFKSKSMETINEFKAKRQDTTPKYLPNIDLKDKLTVICAGLGAGKTTQARRWRMLADSGYLYITARVSLTYNAADRLDLAHYQEEEGTSDDYLAVCINSIHMLLPPEDGYEIVVIDEMEQVIAQMHSSITRRPTEIYKKLKKILKLAKHVVVMDAHMSPQSVKTIRELLDMDEEDSFTKIDFKGNQIFNEIKRYASEESLTNTITQMVMDGETGVIACTAASDAKALNELITGLDQRVLLYHRDVDEEVKETLGSVNETWGDFDWVIFSPTVSSGVSYDLDRFKNVILFARSIDGISYTDLLQQSHRVRKPLSKTLHTWVEDCVYERETRFPKICRMEHDRIQWSRFICENTFKIDNQAAEFARCKHRTTQIQRLRSNNVRYGFYHHWATNRVSVKNVRDLDTATKREIRSEVKERKDALKDGEIQRVLQATLLSKEELESLRDNRAKSLEETYQVRKAECMEFFGDVTEDLIRQEKSPIVRFVNLGLWQTGHLKKLSRRDSVLLSNGHPVLCKHETAKIQTAAHILREAGIFLPDILGDLIKDCPHSFAGEKPYSYDNLSDDDEGYPYIIDTEVDEGTRVREWSSNHLKICGFVDYVKMLDESMPIKERLEGWGVSLPANFENSPSSFLGSLIKSLGLQTSSRRVSVNGRQIRFYSITLDSIRNHVEVSSRYNKKRRGIEVIPVLHSLYEETSVVEDEEMDHGEAQWPSIMDVEGLFEVIRESLKEWRKENPGQKAPLGHEFLYAKIQKKLGRPMQMPEIDIFAKQVSDNLWDGYFDIPFEEEDDYPHMIS